MVVTVFQLRLWGMFDFKITTVFQYCSYSLLAFFLLPCFSSFLSDVTCASNAECRFSPINV